jgi:hypothetical protein
MPKKAQAHVCCNSRRHVLAVDIGSDPAFHNDIEKLSDVLSSGTQNIRERALETAEAEFDLLRIRRIRAWLFETLYFANTALSNGLSELNEGLTKLERYERRAFSRRKRALRAMRHLGDSCEDVDDL